MLLIYNQIFIGEKRARRFRETSLSPGSRRGRSFPNRPQCAESVAERSGYKFPASARAFSLSISAERFRAYNQRAGKTSEPRGQSAHNTRARFARIRFRRRAGKKEESRCGIAVDVYRELKGSKGMDVFRANGGTWNL